MRTHIVLALVGAAAVPVAVDAGMSHLDPAAFGEDSDLMAKAQEIAKKEFTASAALAVLDVEIADHRTGTFGEKIRPDPGYSFHVVRARIENTGRMDIAVSAWHFSASDEAGSDVPIEMGNAHEDFDASRLAHGRARDGTLYFEMRHGSYLTELTWQGDLGNATAPFPSYQHP